MCEFKQHRSTITAFTHNLRVVHCKILLLFFSNIAPINRDLAELANKNLQQ